MLPLHGVNAQRDVQSLINLTSALFYTSTLSNTSLTRVLSELSGPYCANLNAPAASSSASFSPSASQPDMSSRKKKHKHKVKRDSMHDDDELHASMSMLVAHYSKQLPPVHQHEGDSIG